jgi:hypothetical protein
MFFTSFLVSFDLFVDRLLHVARQTVEIIEVTKLVANNQRFIVIVCSRTKQLHIALNGSDLNVYSMFEIEILLLWSPKINSLKLFKKMS